MRGYYVGEETFIGAIYPYYTVSPLGNILGAVYGFVDAAICGAVIAWAYNILQTKSSK